MARTPTPREKRSAQTRTALSEAAFDLFGRYGVDKVTIDDICAQCGVTKGAFYHHFPSKDHIVTYAVNHEMDRYVEENFHPAPDLDGPEALLELERVSFAYFKQLGKAMTRYSYEGQIRSMIVLKEAGRSYVDALNQIVSRCVEQGRFRGGLDAENSYMMTVSVYTGLLLKWSSTSEETDRLYHWDQMLETVIRGLFL